MRTIAANSRHTPTSLSLAVRGVTIFEIQDGLIVAGRLYMEDVDHGGNGIAEAVRDRSGRGPIRD